MITLSPEDRTDVVRRLQSVLLDELSVDAGRFEVERIVDFITANLGVYFYNQGVRDSRAMVMRKVDDISEAIDGLERPLPR
ncbi:MAG TPA: DUF2164 domain-containing protein [Bacteroidetes bacterium]|nr:DUF2164 domain-containing protein [Bacteroidota bacterium]HRK04747.1 DUF2164 domain-containing protein [Chlorobiota bacterium]